MSWIKIIIILFILSLLFIHPLEEDGDFFHHMNIGHFILTNHSLPQTDNLTFTALNKPFVAYAWGAGVVYYLLFNYFQYTGISILGAFLAFLTLLLLYFLIKSYSSQKSALLLTFLAVAPLSIRWPTRPEIFTYPLVLSLLIIDKLKEKKPKLIFFYPLIILIWANIYGSSVLVGLGLLVIFLIKDLYLHKKNNKIAVFLTLLSLSISLLNGYDLKSIFYIFYIPPISSYVLEWRGIFKILSSVPPDLLLYVQYTVLIYFIFLAILLILFFVSYKKILNQPWLIILGSATLVPFFAFRQVPLAVIFSVLAMAYCYDHLGRFKTTLTIFIFIATFTSIGINLWLQKPQLVTLDTISDAYPMKVIDFIKKNNLQGRAFNNQRMGGFLTYYLYPQILIFTDTRDDLYLGTDVIKDLYKTIPATPSVIPLLNKYQIDLAIVDLSERDSYRSLLYSDDYVPVFLDNRYLVAVKKQIAREKNLPILNIIDPYSSTGAKNGQEKEALELYSSILKKDSYNNIMRLAQIHLANNQPDQTITLASAVNTGSGPKFVIFKIDQHSLLARAYLAKNDCPQAKYFIDQVDQERKNKFIFSPQRIIPSSLDEIQNLYSLKCLAKN